MKNKKIAITGGIGSGKSTVCEILLELGYPVISCDKITTELYQKRKIKSFKISFAFTVTKRFV